MQPIVIFRQAMAAHHFATLAARQSRDWLWLNIFLFWLFCGWPLVALCAGRAMRLARERSNASTSLFGATVFVLAAMTISGGVRGETERLWMPFLPPLCVFAASALADGMAATATLKSRARVLEVWVCGATLLLLQAAQTLMMAAALAPLVRPI